MKIFIAPVKFSNKTLLNDVLHHLKQSSEFQTEEIFLDINISGLYSHERKQYYSTGFIEQAIKLTEKYDGKILILTEVDLYVPVLTFLFGEAQLGGKHSLVSVCRLHEEFYSGQGNYNILLERTLKEIHHELGHNFGLKHCTDWDCVMHSSNGIEEVDIKGNYFCGECIKSIK